MQSDLYRYNQTSITLFSPTCVAPQTGQYGMRAMFEYFKSFKGFAAMPLPEAVFTLPALQIELLANTDTTKVFLTFSLNETRSRYVTNQQNDYTLQPAFH